MRKIVLLMLVFGSVDLCHAAEWHIDKTRSRTVLFTSEVLALTFQGKTDQIDGFIYWEGASYFEKNTQVQFEVELNTLNTDNGRRDRDMRDILNTGKWPRAIFKGTSSSITKVDSTVTAYRVKSKGTISIHGVDQEIEVPGLITIENGKMDIKCQFTIKLSDFNIEAPSLIAFVKVNNEVRIDLHFSLNRVNE